MKRKFSVDAALPPNPLGIAEGETPTLGTAERWEGGKDDGPLFYLSAGIDGLGEGGGIGDGPEAEGPYVDTRRGRDPPLR